jgi:CheY-like chemotaxis protein
MTQPTTDEADIENSATPLTILVVDDEEAVARQLSDGLAVLGHEPVSANSGAAALRLLHANPGIGVVVSDIRMPGEDGLGLTRTIQAEFAGPRAVEVVLITGHATEQDAKAAAQLGVAAFLRKPFRLAEAAAAVDTALSRARARRLAAR